MNLRTTIVAAVSAVAITSAFTASAADFFDKSKADKLLTIGARIGVNTTNRTIRNNIFTQWNKNYWGTGFEIGATADINIREYLSVQPGVFFQTRSGDHTYITTLKFTESYIDETTHQPVEETVQREYVQVGHSLRGVITVPVLCRVHFNLTDNLRWNVDAGPYFSWIVGSNDDKTVYWGAQKLQNKTQMDARTFDFGFKLGTGLTLNRHYYFGIHYLAGCVDAWRQKALGGSNMGWTFTLGYDF